MANFHDVKVVAVGFESEIILMLRKMIDNYYDYKKDSVKCDLETLNDVESLHECIKQICKETPYCYTDFLLEMIDPNPQSGFLGDATSFEIDKHSNGLMTAYLAFTDRNWVHTDDFLSLHNACNQIYLLGYHEDESDGYGGGSFFEIQEGCVRDEDIIEDDELIKVLPTNVLKHLARHTRSKRSIVASESLLSTMSSDELNRQKYHLANMRLCRIDEPEEF